MKVKKMNKKADGLTSKQLITIIIIVVSFAIILLFFFFLNPSGEVAKNACSSSLAQKAAFMKIPVAGGFLSDIITLKCKPQTYCISIGGECKGAGQDAKIINVGGEKQMVEFDDLVIPLFKENAYKEINNLEKECWDMTGKGELVFGKDGECGLCSVVYFDEEFQKEVKEFADRYFNRMDEYEGDIVAYTEFSVFSTDKPLAIISHLDEAKASPKKSYIDVTYYNKEGLEKNKCNFLF